MLIITRPSFQEETNYKMAWVFPSSSNRPLLFKLHACTGRVSRDRFPANLSVRGKLPLTCRQEQKAAFLSVGGVNVVVLLPLSEVDNYFGRNV